MNKRRWKELITKRSTIWTLSLCMVGIIVLGGVTAVEKNRNAGDTRSGTGAYSGNETEDGQTDSTSALNSGQEETGNLEAVSGSALQNNPSDGSGSDIPDSAENSDGSDASEQSTQTLSGLTAQNTEDSGESTQAHSGSASQNTESSDEGTQTRSGSASRDGSINTDGSDVNTQALPDSASRGTEDADAQASSSSILSEQALLENSISFGEEQSLIWPSAGTILIDYSMDQSVYFPTLQQYKYNPALIIKSDAGNQVLASAKGVVESVSIDEETGTTLVLNIGNGYRLTYGQLMEPCASEGEVVEAGSLLGYISEPTKYYSTEGSNLYFSMTKDGSPVDPVLYLE